MKSLCFARAEELGQLHRDYEENYEAVVRRVTESEVKNAAVHFSLVDYRLHRATVEQNIHRWLASRLEGTISVLWADGQNIVSVLSLFHIENVLCSNNVGTHARAHIQTLYTETLSPSTSHIGTSSRKRASACAHTHTHTVTYKQRKLVIQSTR